MRKRYGLIISGSIVFGMPYLFSAFGGLSSLGSNDTTGVALLLPVIGPFIVAGQSDFHGLEGFVSGLLLISGLVQTTGAALLIAGLAGSKKVLVRNDIAKVVRPEFFVGPRSVGMKLTF